MARFTIPDAGTVLVFRGGWFHDDGGPERNYRLRWRYEVTSTGGRVLFKGRDISTPREWGVDQAAVAVIGHMLHALETEAGDVPDSLMAWNAWDFESDDNEKGYPDSINWFRDDGQVTKWRRTSYSQSQGNDDWWTKLSDAEHDMRRMFESGELEVGASWDLYPNDSDTPTRCVKVSRRGTVRVVKLS